MNTHADKTQDNKSQSVSNGESQMQSGAESAFQFEDNRPEAVAQRQLQALANNSPQTRQAAQLQAMADNLSSKQQPIQKKENNTGLPDNLKSGLDNLSGYSMDDVKVHHNSDKPAQLQAPTYAQGSEIHFQNQENPLQLESSNDAVVQMGKKKEKWKPSLETILEKDNWRIIQKAILDVTRARMENDWIPELAGVPLGGRKADGTMREFGKTETKLGATLAIRFGMDSDKLWDTLTKKLSPLGLNIEKAEEHDWEKEIAKKLRSGAISEEDYKANTTAIKEIIAKDIPALHALQEKAKKYKHLIGSIGTVMTEGEQEIHLGNFASGVHAFITAESHSNINGHWGGWGRGGDKNFVTSLDAGNKLLADAKKAEDPFRYLEEKLGFPAGQISKQCPENVIWRYIILPGDLQEIGGAMIATGKEGSAFASAWIAGGITEGGQYEATIQVLSKESGLLEKHVKMEAVILSNIRGVKDEVAKIDNKNK